MSQQLSTTLPCLRHRPSSATPIAMYVTKRAKTCPSRFPSFSRTSRAPSSPPLAASHAASAPRLNPCSCSTVPSSTQTSLQQKQTCAWQVSQRLRISSNSRHLSQSHRTRSHTVHPSTSPSALHCALMKLTLPASMRTFTEWHCLPLCASQCPRICVLRPVPRGPPTDRPSGSPKLGCRTAKRR